MGLFSPISAISKAHSSCIAEMWRDCRVSITGGLICLKSALMKSSEQHQNKTFEVILNSKNPAEKDMKLKLHSILCGLRFPRTLKNNSMTTFPHTPLIGQVELHCRRRNPILIRSCGPTKKMHYFDCRFSKSQKNTGQPKKSPCSLQHHSLANLAPFKGQFSGPS